MRKGGLFVFSMLLVATGGYFAASRLGYLDVLQARLLGPWAKSRRLSPGDFPAGVAAPVGDIVSVPLRPTLIGFTPRGSSAALLLCTGGAGSGKSGGVFGSAYALDAQAVVFAREQELRDALSLGAEGGGVDFAAISVDRLATWWGQLRDASPRTVLLLGRSRGQEALAVVDVPSLGGLKNRRLGTYPHSSSHYFALWLLTRAGLSITDVRWIELKSNLEAGAALREGRADAVVGLYGDVELAARDRGGKVLATTADAPHLLATVLVVRGEFAARYPDAVRRVLRGMLDCAQSVAKDPTDAARLLGEVAPYLGDPIEAIRSAPPASLKDNLVFFGLSGEAPVTYDELFSSASALAAKLGVGEMARAEDSRDLGPLKYVSEARGP